MKIISLGLLLLATGACGGEYKGSIRVDHNVNLTVCDRYQGEKWAVCMDKLLTLAMKCDEGRVGVE